MTKFSAEVIFKKPQVVGSGYVPVQVSHGHTHIYIIYI